jgi:hypothetical protein
MPLGYEGLWWIDPRNVHCGESKFDAKVPDEWNGFGLSLEIGGMWHGKA